MLKTFSREVYIAGKNGDITTLQILLAKPLYTHDLNQGLMGACEGGHKAIAEFLIKNGANDVEWGLKGACRGGHKTLVELMIQMGANNWIAGLRAACEGGHRSMVDLILEKRAINWTFASQIWDWGLMGACENGHRHLVDLMIERGATNVDFGLYAACKGKQKEIVDLMIAKGGRIDLSGGINYFKDDKRFVAHVVCRLDAMRRRALIRQLKNEQYFSLLKFLVCRNLVRPPRGQLVEGKSKVRATLLQFVCVDVATWSACFVGYHR